MGEPDSVATRIICSAVSTCADESSAGPTTTVVDPPLSLSQIAHADSAPASGWSSSCGAPGIPSSGPRLVWPNSDSDTGCGLAFVAAINRAEARFNTGCQTSSTRT
ncbi:Uncharacterised protein [Mycobacterium tuberculosis]|uniref:Uncharacterized protein n=1 Tax=Mycobacterium tuberculosis TaxID=1773 RepID=A0A655JKQ6_MYCTX|nr:Uncharacterised protein [Mycobacterium tuberculosis]CNM16835.1 Uncharacterised protein [Mycobacterium tuberculosis]CNM24531.1 Uncharacterised protein [Mycobacterium tuberculosis]CNM80325.1 Uncharacterised protein [Mycobacterium tuberculosis]CNM88924.1 Uncharacterised protein [Mycobacterium tuberculosis]